MVDLHMELSNYEYHKCLGWNEKYCLCSYPVTSSEVPSCVSAIFWSQYNNIKTYCKAKLIQTKRPIRMLQPLGNSEYLAVSDPQDVWYLTCKKEGPRKVPAVQFGKFKLSFDCSLRTNDLFLPPSIEGCGLHGQTH